MKSMNKVALGTLFALALLFLFLFPGQTSAQTAVKVEVTYIGSQGFYIEGGGKKILLDAAMPSGSSEWGYQLPSDDTRQKIMNAQPPYDGIDLITISHAHEDHFDPATVYGAMKNNPKAWLVTSSEAYRAIKKAQSDIETFKDRIWIPADKVSKTEERVINGITISATALSHGELTLQVFAFELAGMRFLHLNDWNTLNVNSYDFIGFNAKRADVAFLGYGYVMNQAKLAIFKAKLNPAFTVVCHVDGATDSKLASLQSIVDSLTSTYPMVLVKKSLDKITIIKSGDGKITGSITPAGK